MNSDVVQSVLHLSSACADEARTPQLRAAGQTTGVGPGIADVLGVRQRVQEGLLREATMAESPAARVRAWELVGKLDGVDAFGAERVETSATVTQKQAETELKQALTAALGDQRVVDLFGK